MKKIYTLALAMMMAGAAWAQRSVTFQVDMSGQTVSANGVHIAGEVDAPNVGSFTGVECLG